MASEKPRGPSNDAENVLRFPRRYRIPLIYMQFLCPTLSLALRDVYWPKSGCFAISSCLYCDQKCALLGDVGESTSMCGQGPAVALLLNWVSGRN